MWFDVMSMRSVMTWAGDVGKRVFPLTNEAMSGMTVGLKPSKGE